MLHEIKLTDWPAFCQRLSEHRAGAMGKLETIDRDGVRTELVTSAELQSIVFSKSGLFHSRSCGFSLANGVLNPNSLR
jgi:hypothetical protein